MPMYSTSIITSCILSQVKAIHPNYSICEVAKELGRRWADMAPEVKQRFQQMAEEGRQKYDQEMAAYRQGNYAGGTAGAAAATSTTPASTATSGTVNVTQGGTTTSYIAGTDYSSLLQ